MELDFPLVYGRLAPGGPVISTICHPVSCVRLPLAAIETGFAVCGAAVRVRLIGYRAGKPLIPTSPRAVRWGSRSERSLPWFSPGQRPRWSAAVAWWQLTC
jgi:hypothetical protein